jgi:hypothetical protein
MSLNLLDHVIDHALWVIQSTELHQEVSCMVWSLALYLYVAPLYLHMPPCSKMVASFSHSRMVYTLFGSYSSRALHSVNNRPIDTLILVAEPASVMNTCILDLELAADKRKRAY